MPYAAVLIERGEATSKDALLEDVRASLEVLAGREAAPSSCFVLGDPGDPVVALTSWRSQADAEDALSLLLGRAHHRQGTNPAEVIGEVGEIVADVGARRALAVHGRLGVFTILPESIDSVLKEMQAGLLPLAQRQPGFCGGVIVRGAADASVLVCHAYASTAESEAAGGCIRPWVEERLSQLTLGLDRCHGDIVWLTP